MENNEITQEKLESAFVEVRKAYRFLYKYQKRILDLCAYISDFFGLKEMKNEQQSLFSDTANKNSSFSSWAWDWMPMYHYAFWVANEEYEMCLRIASDTGYYQRNDIDVSEYYNNAGLELKEFIPEKDSETVLTFYLYKGNWWEKEEEYEKLYYKSLQEASKKIAATPTKDKKPEFELKSEGKLFLAYFPLSLFTSEEKTKDLLRMLIDEADKKGFKIEEKKPDFKED